MTDIKRMMDRLPPRAIDSLCCVAHSTMDNDERAHERVLDRESANMREILSNVELHYWIETVRALLSPEPCLEVLAYDLNARR